MGIEKLTEEEMMNYIKLTVYAFGESAGFDTKQIIDETINEMVKLKIRPKKGGYKIKATVEFDVSLLELHSMRTAIKELENQMDKTE